MMAKQPQEIRDAELVALAALVYHEAVVMAGENQYRELLGETPAYTAEFWHTEVADKLRAVLKSRGVLEYV